MSADVSGAQQISKGKRWIRGNVFSGGRAQCRWTGALWKRERCKFLKVKRMKRKKGKTGVLSGSRSDIRLCMLYLSDRGKSRSVRKPYLFLS